MRNKNTFTAAIGLIAIIFILDPFTPLGFSTWLLMHSRFS